MDSSQAVIMTAQMFIPNNQASFTTMMNHKHCWTSNAAHAAFLSALQARFYFYMSSLETKDPYALWHKMHDAANDGAFQPAIQSL